MKPFTIIFSLGMALLFALSQSLTAQEVTLPEEATKLLRKLDAFETSQSLEVDVRIERAEKSALAILAKHQERETKNGNLDSVLALRKLDKLKAITGFDPQVPADSKGVVLKFQKYAKSHTFWPAHNQWSGGLARLPTVSSPSQLTREPSGSFPMNRPSASSTKTSPS